MNVKNLVLENEQLKAENTDLKKKVESLEKLKNSLKVDNQRLTEDRKILIRKVNELDNRLANVSLWDLSPEQQEAAGHALANDLLGKNR